jgi:hypothetical protein
MGAQQVVQQDLWYIPLVVVLLAGVMSFFGTLAAGFFTRRTEHYKWLRQERLQAYAKYLAALEALHDTKLLFDARNSSSPDVARVLSGMSDVNTARGIVFILGSAPVQRAASDLWEASNSLASDEDVLPRYREARRVFTGAVKTELGLGAVVVGASR